MDAETWNKMCSKSKYIFLVNGVDDESTDPVIRQYLSFVKRVSSSTWNQLNKLDIEIISRPLPDDKRTL